MVEIADRMAEDGYLEAGYNQVNIDGISVQSLTPILRSIYFLADCYLAMSRDSEGKLQPDPDVLSCCLLRQ